ncbi:MAG: hypothetical protein ABI792_07035 [bacterium]
MNDFYADNNGNKINLKIEPEYSNYLFAQRIWLKVTLTNNSDLDYFIKENFDAVGIHFDITTPNRTKLYNHVIVDSEIFDSIKLSPNQIYENVFPIDNYINSLNNVKGVYDIQAIFQNIISNTISIDIERPEGDDRTQYLLFQNFITARDFQKSSENDFKDIEEFLKQYPYSVYAPDLYDQLLIARLMSGKTNNVENTVINFFNSYADSYESKFIVNLYFSYLTKKGYSNAEAISKLKEIGNIYKNSKSDYTINNFIKKLKE